MPPPSVAHKKRKSRSRGSSARRARNKSGASKVANGDQRSASVDVSGNNSGSGCPNGKGLKLDVNASSISSCSKDIVPAPTISKESPILSLADSVATAAITTAESDLKKSPKKKHPPSNKENHKSKKFPETPVKGKPSNKNTSEEIQVTTIPPAMVHEEDKLDGLCKLLERLDSTYGRSSSSSSPVKTKSDPVSPSVISKAEASLNNKKKNSNLNENKENLVQKQNVEKEKKEDGKEVVLSQEEKQALRKAKKEAKKSKAAPKNSLPEVAANSKVESSAPIPQPKEVSNSCLLNGVETSQAASNEKSKAELRRERREKQEAQRLAKKASLAAETKGKESAKSTSEQTKEKEIVKKAVVRKKKETPISDRHIPLLEHLSTPKIDQRKVLINSTTIHPAMRAMGLRMKELTLDGCITRVVATLSAIHGLIDDYQTPPSCDFSRDLSNQLATNIAFLNACRPLSEPMNNAIRFVKREINNVQSSIPEHEAKEEILDAIGTYVHQNIVLASEAIIENALEFIEDSDVILTFGFSALVYETVKASLASKEKISVVVVDNPGSPSGVNILQDFVQLGVKVFYRILPDLPHIIHKVTKVIVEAEAVLLNGAMIGQCGLAGLILLASFHSVPVIVLSHTFKFCNIDLTDSLVVNELGDPSPIVDCPATSPNLLAGWKDVPTLNVVNLIYDVTPSDLINVLVTERNNFPTSVVPVIIKRNYADILGPD